jgi:hypothetical protein
VRSGSHPFERRSALERVLSFRHVSWLRVDWHVLLIAFALLGVGLCFVRAMDLANQEFEHSDKIDFGDHVQKVLISLPLLAVALVVKPRWLRRKRLGRVRALAVPAGARADRRHGAQQRAALAVDAGRLRAATLRDRQARIDRGAGARALHVPLDALEGLGASDDRDPDPDGAGRASARPRGRR